MMSKSSTHSHIKSSWPKWVSVLALILVTAARVHTCVAQQPTPPKQKKSYIRCWNMLPVKSDNVLLVYAGDKSLFGISPLDLYTDYFAAPVGSYVLNIKRTDEKEETIQRIPIVLQDQGFVTLIAAQRGGKVGVELVNDTPDPSVTDVAASVVVRSFFSGGQVSVGVAGGSAPKPVPDGATVTLDGLPMTAGVNIAMQITKAPLPPTSQTWNFPADFSVQHHGTLLLMADRYGRLKPRFVLNGVAPPDAPTGRR